MESYIENGCCLLHTIQLNSGMHAALVLSQCGPQVNFLKVEPSGFERIQDGGVTWRRA